MKKRKVFIVVLAVLIAASVYAQTTDFSGFAQFGTPQEVREALDKGADVNAYKAGMTPLMDAAAYNTNAEVITILLNAGADLEARDHRGGIGGTALDWAAYCGKNPEVVALLLKAGANVEVCTENGMSPLTWAAGDNSPEIVLLLLNAGANAKVKDNNGLLAVDYAKFNMKIRGTEALKKLEAASK